MGERVNEQGLRDELIADGLSEMQADVAIVVMKGGKAIWPRVAGRSEMLAIVRAAVTRYPKRTSTHLPSGEEIHVWES